MICVDPWAYLLAAALILLLPARWLLSAFIAAALHELAHLSAIHMVGGRMDRVRIGSCGAQMDAFLPDNWRELLCAAAGPGRRLCVSLARHGGLCPDVPR